MTEKNETPPVLAVTMGDPAGVGADIITSLVSGEDRFETGLVILGDPALIEKIHGTSVFQQSPFGIAEKKPETMTGETRIVWNPTDLSFETDERGTGTEKSGRISFEWVRNAYRLWEEGKVGGIVTGPVSKKCISSTGRPFYGQTEWFAQRTGELWPVMGMKWNNWIVTVVTRHIPVRKIPRNLSKKKLKKTVLETAEDLRKKLGIEIPSIGVTGLNPHAGEGGMLGKEEQEIIEPVVNELKGKSEFELEGPASAESLITNDGFSSHDAVVAMYHDQGLVPLKARGFHSCAAFTFGLPLIRTSVAHGTAFELAGSDAVRETSMKQAIELAAEMISVTNSEQNRD